MKIQNLTRLVYQFRKLLGAVTGILKLIMELIDMASNYALTGSMNIEQYSVGP